MHGQIVKCYSASFCEPATWPAVLPSCVWPPLPCDLRLPIVTLACLLDSASFLLFCTSAAGLLPTSAQILNSTRVSWIGTFTIQLLPSWARTLNSDSVCWVGTLCSVVTDFCLYPYLVPVKCTSIPMSGSSPVVYNFPGPQEIRYCL